MLAQELFKGYGRKNGAPKCALKVDLHKAFDSLQWEFIIAALQKMHFPEKLISWVRVCICSPSFSVKLNGVIHGYLKGTQGIKQGDPMSPYLFTICMNILSYLLNSKPVDYKHHWRCRELGISHLFFAYDVLFFSSAHKAFVMHIKSCINNTFSGWSGLKPSMHKSSSYLCNCTHEFTTWFDNEYSIPRGCLPVRFIGVPLISK